MTGTRSFIVAILLMVGLSAEAQTMRAHILDVRQGSATILESECAAVLIDNGGELKTNLTK